MRVSHPTTYRTDPTAFDCPSCGTSTTGDPRDHCPQCLHTRHQDPGDPCGATMAPLAVAVHGPGDWRLIHRCTGCATLTSAPVRPDDHRVLLMALAVRPLAQPPFPLDLLGRI
ncbi:RNHCP domain-containing protein [Streptomyces sp. NPDC058374]|uniref:RNHCP domain-containing protein n=1 Tax=unclassified Streptomyces TaxID=2593676 RepID=UPI003660BEFF